MSNVNDNMGNLNNDNNGSITWDDVVAMEDAARDLKEVPAPVASHLLCPCKARTACLNNRISHVV